MKSLTSRKTSRPPTQESIRLLLQSKKFLNWRPGRIFFKTGDRTRSDGPNRPQVDEKHFTPAELAEAWGVSAETIRITFREEPGVLRLKQPTKGKRPYILLRIPESVAERVHRRLSAVPV